MAARRWARIFPRVHARRRQRRKRQPFGPSPTVGTYLDEQPITTIAGALDVHSTISRGSNPSPARKAHCMARARRPARSASSPISPTRPLSAGYDVQGNNRSRSSGYTAEGFVKFHRRRMRRFASSPGMRSRRASSTTFITCSTYPTSGITIDNANLVKKDYNDVETYGGRVALNRSQRQLDDHAFGDRAEGHCQRQLWLRGGDAV